MSKLKDNLEETLLKYKKNKENIPANELETRYAKAFSKLKADLKALAFQYINETYINVFSIEEGDEDIKKDLRLLGSRLRINERIEECLFDKCSVQELERLGNEIYDNLKVVYERYVSKFNVLYITRSCLSFIDPEKPVLYNRLTKKFLNPSTKKWETRSNTEPAVMYVAYQKAV